MLTEYKALRLEKRLERDASRQLNVNLAKSTPSPFSAPPLRAQPSPQSVRRGLGLHPQQPGSLGDGFSDLAMLVNGELGG